MSGEIAQCRDDCLWFVDQMKRIAADKLGIPVDVEIGFCGYKDKGDSGHPAVHVLTKNYESLKRLISARVASGGGDAPEDIAGAFKEVIQWSWAPQTDVTVRKALILIADFPCHGLEYGTLSDDHPQEGKIMPMLLQQLTDKGISLFMSKTTRHTEKMQDSFRKHWETAGKGCIYREIDARREAGTRILEDFADSVGALITPDSR